MAQINEIVIEWRNERHDVKTLDLTVEYAFQLEAYI